MSDANAVDFRDKILSEPGMILDDPDLMAALVSANDAARGDNVVDLRGVAMERLESRLTRLEDTHRSVIAAAYDNLAGTNQVHRAVLAFLEPLDFKDFLNVLATDVADILRVGRVRLVLEADEDAALDDPSGILTLAPPGFLETYAGQGRGPASVTLRAVPGGQGTVFGPDATWVRSEALLLLQFGEGRHPGCLAFASDDPEHFHPSQGTDLLTFLGAAFERAMRRWLD